MRLSLRRSARRWAECSLLATVMVLPMIGISAMSGPTPAGAAATPLTAYVTNELGDSVTPINIATNTAGTAIAGGGTNLFEPEAIAITPDGQTAVVANTNPNIGCGATVTVIKLASDTQTLIDDSELSCPSAVAITPNGQTAYVVSTYNSSGPPNGTVTPIDLANDTAGPSFLAGINYPGSIAITPDGQTAYVTGASDDVAPIDLTNDTVGTLIPLPNNVGSEPNSIAIAPNGQTAYVTGFASTFPSGEVVPINTATNTVGTPITGGSLNAPEAIAIAPNGLTAYVTNADGDWLTPVNLTSGVAGAAITGPPSVYGASDIAIAPDGRTAYVTADGANAIVPFNLSTDVAEAPITGGGLNGPVGIAITPDQAPTASFTMPPPGVKGSPMTFDASASTSPVGSIASYAWNFGDGTTQVTTQPTIAHTYLSGGVYTVTLTVTNTQGTSATQVFTGQTVSNNGGPLAETSQFALVAGLYISGSLPGGTVGASYSSSLMGNFGQTPYHWTISSGSLPLGLHLAGATGAIYGTPAAAGTSNFDVTVTDSFRPHEVATSPESITIAQGTPTLALFAKLGTARTANYGTGLTLTARVAPSNHAVADTGAIDFTANGQPLNALCDGGAGPTLTKDKAVCALFTSDFGIGTLALSASVASDPNYIGATSPPGSSVTIAPAATTLHMTLSPTAGSVSAQTTITANATLAVSPPQKGAASPVGDPVSVEYGGSVLCSAPISQTTVLVYGVPHVAYVASCTFPAGMDGMAPPAAAIVATFNPGGSDSDYAAATATTNLRLHP